MIFLYIIPLSISAVLGLFINGSYYRTGFLNNGYGPFYSLILAISFIVFEGVLWGYFGKNAAISALKVSILIFSISITLGAQFFSTSIREAEIEEKIFNTADVSGDVEYYREQLKTLNKRKDEIIAQQKIFGTARNKDLLESTNADIVKYESYLIGADDKKQDDIEKINKPKTIYAWIAYDVPLIFKSGLTENLVRIIQQLFSSVLLALMAPVSLSMIRMSINQRKAETDKPSGIEAGNTDAIDNTEESEEQKEEIQDYGYEDKRDLKLILDMLLYYYPDSGILSPEKAAEYFINVNKSRPEVKSYSEEECEEVYKIVSPMDGMGKHEIIQEVLKC